MLNRVRVLLLELAAPLGLALILGYCLLALTPVRERLVDYGPTYTKSNLRARAQWQVLRLRHRLALPTAHNRVVLVGSSAVIAGLDEQRINQIWRAQNEPYEALKAGMTGFAAYELPMLKTLLLDRSVDAVVVFLNHYSLGDSVWDNSAHLRWSSTEYLQLDAAMTTIGHINRLATGICGELSAWYRFADLIRFVTLAALANELRPLQYDYDIAPGRPARESERPRHLQPVADPNHLLRARLLSASSQRETIGNRGLRRFISAARAHGIQVILAPLPEPDFALWQPYRQGIDHAAIERRVAKLAASSGVALIAREGLREIEARDQLWNDHIHLHDSGREQFSKHIAAVLPAYLKPD